MTPSACQHMLSGCPRNGRERRSQPAAGHEPLRSRPLPGVVTVGLDLHTQPQTHTLPTHALTSKCLHHLQLQHSRTPDTLPPTALPHL